MCLLLTVLNFLYSRRYSRIFRRQSCPLLRLAWPLHMCSGSSCCVWNDPLASTLGSWSDSSGHGSCSLLTFQCSLGLALLGSMASILSGTGLPMGYPFNASGTLGTTPTSVQSKFPSFNFFLRNLFSSF